MGTTKPTLEDVARAAGVSRMTVSRVVNDNAGVAPAPRQRVQQAIAELGYHPHGAARALASGRTDVVDLVVIDDDATTFGGNPYYSRVVAGVLAALAGTDASMRVHVVDEADAASALAEIAGSAGLGALLVNAPAGLAEEFHRRCDRVVSLGRSGPDVPFIDPDNVAGADAVVRHLYGVGRRRIAAIDGPEGHPCAAGRRGGYRSAMRDAGLAPVAAPGNFRREAGAYATRQLLATHPRLDAIFAACDLTATGALQALAESGRRVPDDVAVIGFDGSVLAASANPPLTSVYQPVEHIASTATRKVLDGKIRPRWHRIFPTALTVRQSSLA